MSLLCIGYGQAKPITIPDQVGGLFFADVQGPFEMESLEGSVYKIGNIEARRGSFG